MATTPLTTTNIKEPPPQQQSKLDKGEGFPFLKKSSFKQKNQNQQHQFAGLTDDEAISKITSELEDLLQQRENHFRDHIEKRKKKVQVALQRIFHPFTLLTLAYTGFLIYNTVQLINKQSDPHVSKVHAEGQITQHLITIVLVLLLVIADVILKIQRLNNSTFNIDTKIRKVIADFKPGGQSHRQDNNPPRVLNTEVEFSYYQNCFTWTLRDGQWKKIPNNTLAKGDIIKLLPDDDAPALIGIIETQEDSEEVSFQQEKVYSPQSPNLTGMGTSTIQGNRENKREQPQQQNSENRFFNKGQKIDLKESVNEGYRFIRIPAIQEPYEAFQKSMKEYILFKVEKTPCVQDLTEFITNMKTRKEFSKNLLYFKNIQKTEKTINYFLAVSWTVCVAINLAFILTDKDMDYFDHHTYLPLISFTFVATQIFAVCEAWANALMDTLFKSVQFYDYNKQYTGKKNYFKQLDKKSSKNKHDKEEKLLGLIKKDSKTVSAIKKQTRKINKGCCQKMINCLLRRGNQQQEATAPRKDRKKKKSLKNTQSLPQSPLKGDEYMKTDQFYEEKDFQNRGFKKNWAKFWEFYFSGCTHINNIFAAMSCASVFAFVDKEGIISETAKYVDEMACIDLRHKKVVLDLVHDSHVNKEEEIYAFENAYLYQENISLLKGLGLAFMLARNPKETDTEREMIEVFTKLEEAAEHQSPRNEINPEAQQQPLITEGVTGTTQLPQQTQEDNSISSKIAHEIGFHFHSALRQETEAHQDCVCALAKLIGHTDQSFVNYTPVTSLWNIVRSVQIGDQQSDGKDKRGQQHNLITEGEHAEKRMHWSVDDQDKAQSEEQKVNKLELNSRQEDALSEWSEDSGTQHHQRNKVIFVAQKQHKKMLEQRQQMFGHVVTSIVQDQQNMKLQSFTRGEANIIFNQCSDYWNGEEILPIKKEVANHIKDILFQWQASDFVAIAFSYKPVTPDVQQLIQEKKLQDPQQFSHPSQQNRDLFESFQKNQIFLGIIGVKHHKKQEANKMFRSLDDAGIRGVLFSKEGVVETKSLAKELGIDSDWNAWISLAEMHEGEEEMVNLDGHQVLPRGIEGIRTHLAKYDKIPLQVPMFCFSTAETTRQMFEIYQENWDVVVCVGNILNSENLHIFQQANVAIGMMIEPSSRCYRCNGRISKPINQKHNTSANKALPQQYQQQYNQNYEYKPNQLEKLSAAINSLACSFVFDANTNIYCFFSIFREARRLRESVEQALVSALFTYLNVFLILFVDLVLGLHHYCTQLEVLYILCIFVPMFSLSCMARPTKNSVMKRHVLSPKYLEVLDFAIFMLKSNLIKVLVASLLLYLIRILYLQEAIENFEVTLPMEYQRLFQDKTMDKNFSEQITYLLHGGWYKNLLSKHQYWDQTLQLEHKFNFCLLMLVLSFLAIGLESPKSTLFYKFTTNKIFRTVLYLQLLFVFVYYSLSVTVFQDHVKTQNNKIIGFYYPSYRIWLAVLAALLIIATVEEVTKKTVRKLYERDHNRLSIFFNTRLGMWSPR